MEPKDMDRQIAKIMGWEEYYRGVTTERRIVYSFWVKDKTPTGYDTGKGTSLVQHARQPSTNSTHALEAAKELSKQGYRTRITLIEYDLGCEVTIFKPGIGKESKHHLQDEICTVYDSSEAMAISLAIIAAKELE